MYTLPPLLYISSSGKFKATIKQRKIGIFTAVDKRLVAQEYSKFHLRAMLVMHQIRSHIQRLTKIRLANLMRKA